MTSAARKRPAPQGVPARLRAARLGAVLVLLLLPVVAVYWQVGHYPFINWDDDFYIYKNAHVRNGLTFEGVAWAVRNGMDSGFIPLTWISRMIDVSLFGLDAGWHHRVNVLFHLADTVLLFLLLRRLTGALWRSALAAALFAVHPLHVESVAWVTERKDVLSALFWFLATLSYVRYARGPGAGRYALVVLFFGLGLLSKPMLVTFPLTLLLLDWWPLGRLRADVRAGAVPRAGPGRLVLEKLPLLAMSAAACVATIAAQSVEGSVASWERYPVGLRVGNAIVSYATYMARTVWPSSLAAIYPLPGVGSGIPAWKIALALLLLGAVTAAAAAGVRRRPWLAVGWCWFVGTLVPVIGLVQAGAQGMADRYTYVPLVGIFVAASWGASGLCARFRVPVFARAAAAGTVVVVLAAAAWAQAGYWRDSAVLFRRTLEVTENNWFAHGNLALTLSDRGQLDEAIAHFRESVRIHPAFAKGRNSLGVALAKNGQMEEAIASYRDALRLDPSLAEAHNNLGNALADRGEYDEAIAHYREALRLRPGAAVTHNNLGVALFDARRYDEAIAEYREALRLDPTLADAHVNLGDALAASGRPGEAAADFREALRLRPGDPAALEGLRRSGAVR